MKQLLITFVLLLTGMTAFAQSEKEVMSGKWIYSAYDAPYGYEEGEVVFNSENDKLRATLYINGYATQIQKIKKEHDLYTCHLIVDGSSVEVAFKPTAEGLSAKATFEGMTLDVKFKRPQK